MEKAEARAILKSLQAIVNNKGDDQVPDVIKRLQARLDELKPKKRGRPFGRDRLERESRDRGESDE